MTTVSERARGGNSYIVFKEDQFASGFVKDAPIRQAADDSGIQFTTPQYEEAYKKFDEIDNVKEWQDSVKAFVKSSREINPDIRTPELEQSAKDLLAGKIDRSQHLKNIDNFKPVRPFTELPREPSDKSLIFLTMIQQDIEVILFKLMMKVFLPELLFTKKVQIN